MSTNKIIVPQCCNYAKNYITLIYHKRDYTDKSYFLNNKPIWIVRGCKQLKNNYAVTNSAKNINFCPSCGLKLPEIKKKRKSLLAKLKLMNTIDGGYYCNSCDERLIACQCSSPLEIWELEKEL